MMSAVVRYVQKSSNLFIGLLVYYVLLLKISLLLLMLQWFTEKVYFNALTVPADASGSTGVAMFYHIEQIG